MFGTKLYIFKNEWLDVVFEGRNKEYGAYDLRKLSPRATSIGLLIASSAFVVVLMAPAIARWVGIDMKSNDEVEKLIETEVVLQEPPTVNEEETPPPPPVEPPPPRVDQVRQPEHKRSKERRGGKKRVRN